MSVNLKIPGIDKISGNINHAAAAGTATSNDKNGAAKLHKVNQYWEMLDELHQSDPEAYKNLIEQQMQVGRKKARTRQFRPEPSFVIKAWLLSVAKGRRKFFINICGYKGVEPPKSANGTELNTDEAFGYQARSIPLLVSPMRQVAVKVSQPNSTESCVDVVFNPWVIRKCEVEAGFKQQVMHLAIKWVQQEHSETHKFTITAPTLINSKYKGGSGSILRDPVPFPITLSEDEMKDIYPEDQKKDLRSRMKQPFANESMPTTNKTGAGMMQSPGDLLKAFQVDNDEQNKKPSSSRELEAEDVNHDNTMDRLLNLGSTKRGTGNSHHSATMQKGYSRLDADSKKNSQSLEKNGANHKNKLHPGIREVLPEKSITKNGNDLKKSNKKKNAVRKGFMFRKKKSGKKHAPLYPEGSKEHTPKNPYPWANVIDLGSSDTEKLQRQMQQYAESGNVDEPTFKAEKPKPKKLAEWDPEYKKQQERQNQEAAKRKAAREREAKARASISKEEEAQLDKLMAAADDGFGNLFKENDVEGAEFYETLQTAMNLMGSSGNDHMTSAPTACNSESMEQFVAMTNRLMYNEKAAVKKPSETSNNDASALANKLKGWAADSKSQITVQQPKFTLAKVTDKKGQLCEKVVIHLPKVQKMEDIDLQLSDSELKLNAKTEGGMRRKLRVVFQSSVDSSVCKAKFKKGKLTVSVKSR